MKRQKKLPLLPGSVNESDGLCEVYLGETDDNDREGFLTDELVIVFNSGGFDKMPRHTYVDPQYSQDVEQLARWKNVYKQT